MTITKHISCKADDFGERCWTELIEVLLDGISHRANGKLLISKADLE